MNDLEFFEKDEFPDGGINARIWQDMEGVKLHIIEMQKEAPVSPLVCLILLQEFINRCDEIEDPEAHDACVESREALYSWMQSKGLTGN